MTHIFILWERKLTDHEDHEVLHTVCDTLQTVKFYGEAELRLPEDGWKKQTECTWRNGDYLIAKQVIDTMKNLSQLYGVKPYPNAAI